MVMADLLWCGTPSCGVGPPLGGHGRPLVVWDSVPSGGHGPSSPPSQAALDLAELVFVPAAIGKELEADLGVVELVDLVELVTVGEVARNVAPLLDRDVDKR